MIKDFIIVGIIWLSSLLVWHIDYAEFYKSTFEMLAEYYLSILTYGTLGAICLVLISFFLRALSFFSLMRMFTQFIFELSQLAICFLSVFSVILLFDPKVNLWLDLGTLSVIPFEILIASCVSLHLFDFNYPLAGKIIPNLTLPFLSVLIVFSVFFSGVLG